MMGIVDFVKAISPPWLVGHVTPNVPLPQAAGVSERFLYALSEGADYIAEKIDQAIFMRFPGAGDPSSLPELAHDRRITRGYAETDADFSARLRGWLTTWRRAGTPASVAEAISGYLGVRPQITSVLQGVDQSTWDVLPESADPTGYPVTTHADPQNWTWDVHSEPIATAAEIWRRRRWLIIAFRNYATATDWVISTAAWGDATWGETNRSWGFDSPPAVFKTLVSLAKTWKSAGARYWWIIVNFDSALFVPSLPPGDPKLPDTSFENWSKIDTSGVRPVRKASRFFYSRYIACEVSE